MQLSSLRELVVLFDTQLQQLTLFYLADGFFALHTVAVSIASLVVCASLAVATSSGSGGSAAPLTSTPLLFTSFTSFASLSVLTLMTLTLLYRAIGGGFVYSPRETAYVVDWILDTVSRPAVEDTVHLLLAPNKRRERGREGGRGPHTAQCVASSGSRTTHHCGATPSSSPMPLPNAEPPLVGAESGTRTPWGGQSGSSLLMPAVGPWTVLRRSDLKGRVWAGRVWGRGRSSQVTESAHLVYRACLSRCFARRGWGACGRA